MLREIGLNDAPQQADSVRQVQVETPAKPNPGKPNPGKETRCASLG